MFVMRILALLMPRMNANSEVNLLINVTLAAEPSGISVISMSKFSDYDSLFTLLLQSNSLIDAHRLHERHFIKNLEWFGLKFHTELQIDCR